MTTAHAAFSAGTTSSPESISPASLYIGDLHPDVTESILYDAFAEFKSLDSARICKDASTGRSLCYGYVNFLSRQDANLAIEEKNLSMLNGKMIRVMWSVRDPEARKKSVGNIFVKNLPESINNVGLQDMFKKFGSIVSSKVATFEGGKSRGYGFVQFEQEDSAHAAIENLNGTTVGDKEICVENFVRKTDRATPEAKYTNLYIKNLDSDVSEDLLQEKFSEFGKIVSLAIAKDENGSSKGFAFVNFDIPEDARRAADTMNGTQFGSKSLYVGRAQKKTEREQLLREQFEEKCKEQKNKHKVSNIYVKNIDVDVTDEKLREHFSQCGTITSAKVMRNEIGNSKGFGFVCFSTPEEASNAVTTFHGKNFHGKQLYVAIAQRKEDRTKQLRIHFDKLLELGPGGSSSSAAIIPGTYPFYYANPQSGMLYQSFGQASDWKSTNLMTSSNPKRQPTTYPMVGNAPRHNKENERKLSGHAVSYVPHLYQSTQMLPLSIDNSNHQRIKHYGHGREMKKAFLNRHPELHRTMSFAAPLEQPKQMLGEQLFPLVQNLQPQLAAKITGILLEMDKAELCLLLASSEYLAVKVHEAYEVLKSSKPNHS